MESVIEELEKLRMYSFAVSTSCWQSVLGKMKEKKPEDPFLTNIMKINQESETIFRLTPKKGPIIYYQVENSFAETVHLEKPEDDSILQTFLQNLIEGCKKQQQMMQILYKWPKKNLEIFDHFDRALIKEKFSAIGIQEIFPIDPNNASNSNVCMILDLNQNIDPPSALTLSNKLYKEIETSFEYVKAFFRQLKAKGKGKIDPNLISLIKMRYTDPGSGMKQTIEAFSLNEQKAILPAIGVELDSV